ncbi:MAG: ACT domain-containing protein, partial [Microthrixaceae bacterium]|nr:ACT domain-containing protein [Microthrixaceae bacterium]
KPSVVMIDDHAVDVPPAEHLLVVRNDDRPGMIGTVGAVVGAAGINIDDMAVGAGPDGERALMVMATSASVPEAVATELRATDGINAVSVVN